MIHRPRLYDAVLKEHLETNRQMAMVAGPRQVGKTTTCRGLTESCLSWDNTSDRRIITQGPSAVAAELGLGQIRQKPLVALLDELHKWPRWKSFLKGFFDTYEDRLRILVTGSSRLDVYRRGGDSLMGRYFLYHMHPFTVGEVAWLEIPDPDNIVRAQKHIPDSEFDALWRHGGYPEPFVRRDSRFTRRWAGLRRQQLLREDMRDMTQIRELGQLESLVGILEEHSGDQLVYAGLSRQLQVTIETVRRWVDTLCGFHFGFLVRPWFRNVSKAIRKEPKWFLRDWSGIAEEGKRAETFVACHLLKAVEGWTDLGLGEFQLAYVRDKLKREVDFLIVRDRKPWILVEAKKGEEQISPALAEFQKQTGAPYAFQAVLDAPYVNADCFERPRSPLVVPARTFLSQLL